MFFLQIIITGLVIGIISRVIFGNYLFNYLSRLSIGKQLLIIASLGILLVLVMLSVFVSFFADMTGMNTSLLWIIMIPSIFSAPALIIIIIVFYKIALGGYAEFLNIANEIIGPIIAGVVGFVLGLFHQQESQLQLYEPELFAVWNFITGFISGSLSAAVAFITKKILKLFYP